MPEIDEVEALTSALEVKNAIIEQLTAELATARVLLRRSQAALDAVIARGDR